MLSGVSTLGDENKCARQALLDLCDGASRRAAVDTTDSWMMHAPGAELRAKAIQALLADPEIGQNIGKERFLHVAGVPAGSGLEIVDSWLRPLLYATVGNPALERSDWGAEVDRFLDVLSVRDGMAPCTVRAALVGVTLTDAGFDLGDAVVRSAVDTDFHVPIGGTAPTGVVFEYRTRLPASAGPVGFPFSDELVAEMETAHQNRLTHFLLALAFATEAPIQEQLVMKEIDFGAGGSGKIPEEAGPIVSPPRFLLDEGAIERIRASYDALAETDLSRLGVATRRYLMARTERVRPADQIIDYAIALESMTAEYYAEKQGRELGRLLGKDPLARKTVESEHKTFRAAREAIVHDGRIPPDAKQVAQIGRDLVRRSLRTRSRTR
jgi:hypothetical protein